MTRYRDYAIAHTSSRPLIQRGLVVILLVTGVMLLVLGRSHHPAVAELRSQLLGIVRPVLSAASQPVSSVRGVAKDTRGLFATFEQNRKLEAENDSLRHWRSVAMALKSENEALRRQLRYKPLAQASYTTARVIGTSPGSFSHRLMLNAGTEEGLKPMQPVIDAHGLVGRVIETSGHASEVLLLSDVTSHVPVITGESRKRAILTGTGGDLLRLDFLDADAQITLGEDIVTTEEGQLIPGGIAVGTVFRHDDSGYLVKPLRPLAASEYVRVVEMRLSQPPAPAAPKLLPE